jgi:hypothetical protein
VRYLYLILSATLVISCATTKEQTHSQYETEITNNESVLEECFNFEALEKRDRMLADSLLYNSLNNTGLHTFTSKLKPMSDIAAFRWQVEPEEDNDHQPIEFIDEYIQLNRIAEAFSCGPLKRFLPHSKGLITVKDMFR